MFLKIGVLKNFGILRENHLCWSPFLIKLQACNFPVNIVKLFFKNNFFHETPPVAASEKFIIFQESISGESVIDLSF